MNVIALAIGGFIGTILRYEIGVWFESFSGAFPLATLIINLSGSLFLGWFFTITLLHWKVRPEIRLGLGTGLAGAYTTFSAFSVQSVEFIQAGRVDIAAIYIGASVLGGIALTLIGVVLAKAQANRKGVAV
ncbi:fluoride efflux transporter FluC [Paenibacillus eucommiae]|uniref:Fluoride-specific ion channel FluC n=1 Tax=Paenibacillus eucommiae TaxID=1355755 RepID=A0ABS4IT17_9BACL|nr:CrcB family protein [Paenibacillus eucommiae]MBP1990026.1 CrcB protein [Paenibacillus eucommiae]